jgi:hypothetical protein
MTHLTFTKRRLEKITIKRVDKGSLLTTDSTGFAVPEYVIPEIKEGDTLYLELYKFNDIGGLMKPNGEYLFHRSDDYFIQRLAEFIAENKRKGEEMYHANKADYIRRTKDLPERYRNRLNRFLDDPKSAESFRKEPMGWGYELIICELAVQYEASGGEDNEDVMTIARHYGTSGNQHDVAKAWAANPEAAI